MWRRIRSPFLAAFLTVVALGVGALAIPISQWSQTASENGSGVMGSVPDGAPENWTGSQINDTVRQALAVVRAWYDDPQWLEITYALATRGTKTLSRVDADTIDILATNATAYFLQGRRIRIVGATTVTCYVASNATMNGSDTRIEVGTSCTVPTSPTTINLWFGYDARSGAFATAGQTLDGIVIGRGLFTGRISWTSVTQVAIARGYNQKIAAEVDGVLAESSSDLTVDITTADREDTAACGGSASEQASTWYYIYLDEASNVLVEHISSTAPVMDPASGKVGYHPGTCSGSTGWRYVAAVYNNVSSDIQAFDQIADGWMLWRRSITTTPYTQALADPGGQTTYTTASLTLPATARAVRIAARLRGEDSDAYYGHESLSGSAVSAAPSPNWLGTTTGDSGNKSNHMTFDVPVDSSPAIAWGGLAGGTNFALNEISVVGWRDDIGLVH